MVGAAMHSSLGRAEKKPCDLLIAGGEIIDGAGGPSYKGAVAIHNGRIVGIGDEEHFDAKETLRIEGSSVCPGFIDAHTHDDAALLETPEMTFKTSQGVTTVITGNCGLSLAPLATHGASAPAPLSEIAAGESFRFDDFSTYLQTIDAAPAAVNVAALVGHTTLRAKTMDTLDRAASQQECKEMAQLCEDALDAGAIGVSSGLFYPPAQAAPAQEVIEIARRSGQRGGLYTAHIRSEADDVLGAIDEAVDIAEQSGTRLVISHHKVSGVENFGRSHQTLRRIAKASTKGAVAFDAYPYTAGYTMLNAQSYRSASKTVISWSEPHPELAGLELNEAAKKLDVSPEEALERLSPGGAVYFLMSEHDVRRILSSPNAMIGSDGVPFAKKPHPRLYGAFTKVLGHYARDEGLFTLEEAVRRMTSLTASTFGLADRGTIAEGAIADLVIINPRTVSDQATYENPTQLSTGIERVLVAGETVFTEGAATRKRPGRVLRANDRGIVQ